MSVTLKKLVHYYLMRLFYLTRSKKHITVYFDSFSGYYSDSPKAISEAVHRIDPSIEIIWTTNGKSFFPEYVKLVRTGSIKSIKAMAQSKVWVTHGRGSKESGYWKGRDVLSIATWHGDRAFKKIGHAAYTAMGDNYHHSKNLPNFIDTDYLTVGSDWGIKQAREGLGYHGKLLCHGLPRNDKLVRINEFSDEIRSIKCKLNIPQDVRIVLYAPTFRDHVDRQPIIVDLDRVFKSISKDGDKWIVLARVHTHVKQHESFCGTSVMDVSDFGDMADLLLITDCLITDYSSSAGDFILTERPCILAHFDREMYEKESRSLVFDPDTSGFLIAKSQKELDDILEHIHEYNHKIINKSILDFYGAFETGKAADITANKILTWLNSNTK